MLVKFPAIGPGDFPEIAVEIGNVATVAALEIETHRETKLVPARCYLPAPCARATQIY